MSILYGYGSENPGSLLWIVDVDDPYDPLM